MIRTSWAFVTVAALAACDDAVGPPAGARDLEVLVPNLAAAAEHPPPGSVQAALATSADTNPEEYPVEAIILHAWVTPWFDGETAHAKASMRYTGTEGSVKLNMALWFDGAYVGAQDFGPVRWAQLLPAFDKFLYAQGRIPLARECGYVLKATGDFHAAITVLPFTFSAQTENRTGDARNGTCETETRTDPGPGTGEGAGGGGDTGGTGIGQTCYILTTYYIETGEVISVTFLGCYQGLGG